MGERALLAPAVECLVDAGYVTADAFACLEVPVVYNRCDAVFVESGSAKLVAVELKMSDWKRVWFQTMRHRIWATQVFAVMGRSKLPNRYQRSFDLSGVGVLLSGAEGMVVGKPPHPTSLQPSETLRDRVLDHMKTHAGPLASLAQRAEEEPA